jgi:hypothetical protein
MHTNSCRVIVSCFLDGRDSRNNSPPTKKSSLNFLQRIIDVESRLESDLKYDLIIINHDAGYETGNQFINSINNMKIKNGKIKCVTTPNKQSSFDGYDTSFNIFKNEYENWIFSEDDHILFANNYYDIFMNEYNDNIQNNIGFLSFAPISTTSPIKHSGGGFGLCKHNDLNNVLKINNGNLPSFSSGYDIRQSEMMFTNSFIKIGKELILQKSFSCYPINHHMCADHSIHRTNSKDDSEKYFFQVGIKNNEKWE